MAALELLLITTCLNQEPACDPAFKGYYSQSKVLQNLNRKIKYNVKEAAGIWAPILGPTIVFASNKKLLRFRIYRGVILKFGPDENTLNLDVEF